MWRLRGGRSSGASSASGSSTNRRSAIRGCGISRPAVWITASPKSRISRSMTPRPFGHGALPPHFPLDSQQPREQLAREERGLRCHHLIQKPRLIGNIPGLGLIEGRSPRQAQGGATIRSRASASSRPGPPDLIPTQCRRFSCLKQRVLRTPTPPRNRSIRTPRSVPTRPRGVRSRKPNCIRYGS